MRRLASNDRSLTMSPKHAIATFASIIVGLSALLATATEARQAGPEGHGRKAPGWPFWVPGTGGGGGGGSGGGLTYVEDCGQPGPTGPTGPTGTTGTTGSGGPSGP